MKKFERIRKNEEFSSIISKRHSRGSRFFVVYWQEKKEENARIGISVSKKLGNAVVRNKVKRQLRMMCHELLDLSTYPLDLIIIVKKGFLDMTYAENKKDLEILIKKNIIKQYE